MKYFFDTEFLEGPQKTWYGKTKPVIDLISIGIVTEGGGEYYAISKDFNLKEAWNRYENVKVYNEFVKGSLEGIDVFQKIYWIRDNVLHPIFKELYNKSVDDKEYIKSHYYTVGTGFTFSHLKSLIKWYGKTNKEIARDVKNHIENWEYNALYTIHPRSFQHRPIEFYAYYADYDWVVFCWLFGKMIDLPKAFPMYCRDLKQMLDEKQEKINQIDYLKTRRVGNRLIAKHLKIKEMSDYPKQTNEHNALDDARWNFNLYKFLKKL